MWLDLYLDPAHPRRRAASLYEQIRDAVSTGRLAAGERLPTSRSLAHDLGISRSTVSAVFGRLVAEGVLDARVGAGTFVGDHPLVGSAPPVSPLAPSSLTRRHPIAAPPPRTVPDGAVDLRTGRPDPALFPLRDWRRAVVDAAALPPPGYGDAAGAPGLRNALASWVRRSRGLEIEADHVLVTAGAQQAFELLAQTVLAPGDTIAFEEPGYEPARRAFQVNGVDVQPVAVDRDGMCVDDIGDRVRAVYVTPSHQSTTGVAMSTRRRRALIELAHARDLVVIEDDYDTEFRYVGRPLEPLHRLDPDGRVVYVGTFSKSLSPSLRIGFVVAPPGLVADLTTVRRTRDVQPPHLTQAALTNLIVSGALDRHIRRARTVYRGRHELVRRRIGELHEAGLVAAPWPSMAGLHTMIELGDGIDAAAVCDELERRGIVIGTTDDHWIGPPRAALSVGFGLADTTQLAAAFDALEDVLRTSQVR